MGPGRRAEGRPDRHRRAGRLGRGRAVREPGPRDAAARATSWRGDRLAARPGPRAVRAARLGVYLHGLAGEAVRERLGDAGLLASDLPDAIAVARKRLAAVAERRGAAEPARASGVAAAATPPDDAPAAGGDDRDAGPAATRDRSRTGSRRPACRRCRGPPGSRSTSTRSRPTSRSLRELAGPGVRVEPVVKADAYGHGDGAGRPGARGGRRRRALRRDLRRGGRAARRPGIERPILVLYPDPAGPGRARPRGAGSPSRVGDAALLERTRSPRSPRRPRGAAPELEVELEVETGSGAAASPPTDVVAAARVDRGRAGRPARRASGRTSRRPRIRPRTARPGRARSRRRSAALAAAGDRRSAPPPRGERRRCSPRTSRPTTRSGPGLMTTASSPDELEPASTLPPAAARSAR